jgi:large subunit ribosomal protein L12
MEYVYAALLLHKLNKDITEDNVKNVIKATGASPDEVKIKALVAALSEVNIEESLKATPMAMAVPTTAAAAGDAGATEAKDEKTEHKTDEKKEEEALEGLSSLFG